MTTATRRIFNFSAGPAVLPLAVLEEAQRDLVALPGVGMSVTEISHRSRTFVNLLNGAIEDIRTLAGVPVTITKYDEAKGNSYLLLVDSVYY